MEFSVLEARILSLPEREQGPGATIEEIDAAEQKLGLKLAGGYRWFVERFGWLAAGPTEIYGIGADVPKHMSLVEIALSERTEMHPRLQPNLVPVMNDGAGNLYCIDTTSGTEPVVVFWDHDLDSDQEPERESDSFQDWLYERLGNL
jgi:cell wall assembly regulator SMI1